MFARLFAQSGLSLDRLRALVEVGARGGIVRAAEGDPARQSQFSRQIKELEDFFQVALVERHGKGVRLTAQGKELARISRFFLLGLSNFQRGCLAEGQTYRIGAGATFLGTFLVPLLAGMEGRSPELRFGLETVNDAEAERRLHDLTLDFAIVSRGAMSRPLQTKELGHWPLSLWVPKRLCPSAAKAARLFTVAQLPLIWPVAELPLDGLDQLRDLEPSLTCNSFFEASRALAQQKLATVLPEILRPESGGKQFLRFRVPILDGIQFGYYLAWNPRLLRLNPHAARRRDSLVRMLTERLTRPVDA